MNTSSIGSIISYSLFSLFVIIYLISLLTSSISFYSNNGFLYAKTDYK